LKLVLEDGERNISRICFRLVLDDHVHVDVRVRERLKDLGRDSRAVLNAEQRDLSFIFCERNTADNDFFHGFILLRNKSSFDFFMRVTDPNGHVEFFANLDRARVHDLGAERGEFQDLIIRHLVHFFRIRDHTRVRGINAVHVSINFAMLGLERYRERHGRQIRTAPAERGDLTCRRLPLKPGHDHDLALNKRLFDAIRADILDACLAMKSIGNNADLWSRKRNRFMAQFMDRHREQRDRDLLSGREQHVHLALLRVRIDLFRKVDQIVGHISHRGNDDHDLVARLLSFDNTLSDSQDLLRVRDRRTTVLLNNE